MFSGNPMKALLVLGALCSKWRPSLSRECLTLMQPFHEATKHGELTDFTGLKHVAKLKICHQGPKNMSLGK